MKIALLNLPFDSNYGGNLQRYALVKVLQDMGADVEHIFIMYRPVLKWYKKPIAITSRVIRRFLGKYSGSIYWERDYWQKYLTMYQDAIAFYNKYIPHTDLITNKSKLNRLHTYDAYIVGSDQVWRKKIASAFGLSTFFFDFLNVSTAPRYAYAVSLGTEENELNDEEIKELAPLYAKFIDVSVRESSGLKLLANYGWNTPRPHLCLDPTLLLEAKDYNYLIEAAETKPCAGNLFCYILDKTPESDALVIEESKKRGLIPFEQSLGQDGKSMTIEQWLRCFRDSDFIITDSYHGTVFSIIFKKPHITLKNNFRGNTRLDELERIFHSNEAVDYENNEKYRELRGRSFEFLQNIVNLLNKK